MLRGKAGFPGSHWKQSLQQVALREPGQHQFTPLYPLTTQTIKKKPSLHTYPDNSLFLPVPALPLRDGWPNLDEMLVVLVLVLALVLVLVLVVLVGGRGWCWVGVGVIE